MAIHLENFPKRPRGRPRKNIAESLDAEVQKISEIEETAKKRRGRPPGGSNAKKIAVTEDVTSKILVNLAVIFGASLSGFTARRFGNEHAMTVKEGIALTTPIGRLIARHSPTIGIDTKLPKEDAQDIEQILTTIAEYGARLVAQAIARARLRAAGISRETLLRMQERYQEEHAHHSSMNGFSPVPQAAEDTTLFSDTGDESATEETNETPATNTPDMFTPFDAPTDYGENIA